MSQGKGSKSFEFGATPTSFANADETASITKGLPSAVTIHIDHGKVAYLLGDIASVYAYAPAKTAAAFEVILMRSNRQHGAICRRLERSRP